MDKLDAIRRVCNAHGATNEDKVTVILAILDGRTTPAAVETAIAAVAACSHVTLTALLGL